MAYDFNGTNAKISWGDVTFLDGLDTVSVHFWLNVDVMAGKAVVAKAATDLPSPGLLIYIDNNSIVVNNGLALIYNDGIGDSNTAVSAAGAITAAAGWQSVGGQLAIAGTGLRTRVGGTAGSAASTTGYNPFPNITAPLQIGAPGNDAQFFDGQVAELAFWDRVLGDAEWTALAAGDSPIVAAPSGLLFYARLLDTATDEIGSLTGTITNATTTTHPTINYGGAATTLDHDGLLFQYTQTARRITI